MATSSKATKDSCMATQPNKGKGAWEGNEKEESVWEEAVRTVRKREKEELERKKKEEQDNKMAERARMQREYEQYGTRRRGMRRSRLNGTAWHGKIS
ncbi:hypothetical protein QYE76_070760 [Lolium multiflorum]|uniref:Uncharacterized protein n=1 Tax=Lolium multiflorum TaxID=4521 RepID=A0AAD8WER4_LOLMU|nr:hypothetical protein QYE76_070760 [Lolium multiflorum]